MRSERLTDRGRIRALLQADRKWAAYALGDLEPGYFEDCVWYRAGGALAMLYTGFQPPILFAQGPASDVRDLSADVAVEHPAVALLIQVEHLPMLEGILSVSRPIPMWRMVLNQLLFQASGDEDVAPLGHEALDEINDLFGSSSDAPDTFTPEQLERGMFYGVRVEGRLDALAGTHVVSQAEGVAAVGSVFVRPQQRGRGLGFRVTRAVTARLVEAGIETIVLNVAQANAPAIRMYEKLGYRRYCAFYEGTARRAEPIAPDTNFTN